MLLQLPLGPLHLPVLIQVKSAESLRAIRTDRKIRCVGQPTHLISFWKPFALRRFSRSFPPIIRDRRSQLKPS
jgi:hypothetical protein